MKFLQICHKPPFPPVDGGCIAMNNLTQGLLANNHQVKVLSIATPIHAFQEEKLPKHYTEQVNPEAVFIDTSIKPIAAFLNLFTTKSYNVSRFYSKKFEKQLINILSQQEFDYIILDGLYASPYLSVIKQHSKSPIILRAHNIENLLWQRNAYAEKNLLKRQYLFFLAKRLRRYELRLFNQVDAILPITPIDQEYIQRFSCQKNIFLLPFCINSQAYKFCPAEQEDRLSLFHLGSMDWLPNLQGVQWFLSKVWGKLSAKHPNLKLYLAGKNMPQSLLKAKMPNVIIEGYIADPQNYMQQKGIMIVPLLSGGGMRVKIIEGMAMGKVIVSTSIGAEGIAAIHQQSILIADTTEEFILQIENLLNDSTLYTKIKNEARKVIENQYDNEKMTSAFVHFLETTFKN